MKFFMSLIQVHLARKTGFNNRTKVTHCYWISNVLKHSVSYIRGSNISSIGNGSSMVLVLVVVAVMVRVQKIESIICKYWKC